MVRLVKEGRITDLHSQEVEVYGAAATAVDAEHAADRALVALLRTV